MASPSSVLSIVLLVVGVAMMLVVHILVVFWALRQGLGARSSSGAEARAEDGGGGGSLQGLSTDELDTLPCYDFKEKTGVGGDCAVCLEVFEDGDRLRLLPRCGHSFHAPCVDSWLRKSRWCPVCRADVVNRPKVERKLATGEAPGDSETAEMRSPVTLEIVAER